MGILTLGLLGVAALIPVGGFYQQKAEIADRASAIAQAAMNELVTSGMLDPRAWRVMAQPVPAQPPGPVALPSDPMAFTFQRPFATVLSEAIANTLKVNYTAAQRQQFLARTFGHVFVIDPLAVAGASMPPSSNPTVNRINRAVAVFPASAVMPPSGVSYGAGWTTWWWGSNPNSEYTWPVRRVTFLQSGSPTQNMTSAVAAHYFRGQDDLSFDFPARDDRPAIQNWDVKDRVTPLARKWTGDYSWIATVVPTTSAARDALASTSQSHAYDVSVIVFHKRAIPVIPPQTTQEGSSAANVMVEDELYAKASIISSGVTGGELLLERTGSNSPDAFQQLRVGQWIMLCGPHPRSTDIDPRFVLNWYQVLSVDTTRLPNTQRRVAVRGPQWPWQPSGNTYDLSNNLCVGIIRGAVAVHTKTIRLEGGTSAWAMR
jgi:hypothetical protein